MTQARKPIVRRIHGARSETGYVRRVNEDRMGWSRTAFGEVYVVSDGMGGYRGGAIAAETTVQTLKERLAAVVPQAPGAVQQVREAFLAANAAVFDRRRPDDPDTRDMGATGVALLVAGAQMLVGHVGDSRAYLWRRGEGLKQLTRDHTRVQKMLDARLISPEQAASHPEASVLDRALGHQPTVEVDVSDWIPLRAGDQVLLCSDGLSGYVPDAEIGRILRSHGTPQAVADKLVQRALDKGGEDNVTVQLVRVSGGQAGSLLRVAALPVVLAPVCMGLSAVVAALVTAQLATPADGRVALLERQLAASRQELAALRSRTEAVEQLALRAEPRAPVAAAAVPPAAVVAGAGTAATPAAGPVRVAEAAAPKKKAGDTPSTRTAGRRAEAASPQRAGAAQAAPAAGPGAAAGTGAGTGTGAGPKPTTAAPSTPDAAAPAANDAPAAPPAPARDTAPTASSPE